MLDAAAIAALREAFAADLTAAASPTDIQAVRDKYLSRKRGLVTAVMTGLAHASPDERRELGRLANELKAFVESSLGAWEPTQAVGLPHIVSTSQASGPVVGGRSRTRPPIDPTLPGRVPILGNRHPLTLLRERVEGYFARSGYEVLDGPETEDDYHNFEALNLPAEHPARDMQDTLYLSQPFDRAVVPVGANCRVREPACALRPATLLRTHTSAMQIRYMARHDPPVRIICPGRVYRRDNLDQTHTPMFQQVEGLVVGERVTMADLKGTIVGFLRELFGTTGGADGALTGRDIDIVFRPTFFPYTEPSADVFLRDPARGRKWLEVLGCGMVHPAVFEAVGYDPERYTGFAFGMGIERLAMLLFGVDDIRQFYENDMRFLEQFPQ